MDKVISFQTQATQELDEADMIVLKCMLYRPHYLESSKTTPRFLVDAIKYLRVKYSLPLVIAKNLADAIVVDAENIFTNKGVYHVA